MLEIKYVMINDVLPVLFCGMNHKDMEAHGKITSAGFVDISRNGELSVVTYGESSTLKLGPKDTDAAVIKNFLMRGRERC
jgi:hypothetical protein